MRHQGSTQSANDSIGVAISRQLNVMQAVILRDIRSRYFNHGLGYLIVPLLPVGHILILLVIYNILNRQAVFGEDLWLFFATGMVPSLTFTYVSRFMTVSVLSNKNMLSFPAVHLLDIMLARAVLEFASIVLSIVVVTTILISVGSDVTPVDLQEAILAMAATSLLAVGVGTVVSVITAIWPFFVMVYALFMVVIYLSSGAPIYLHAFPEQVIYYCSFNPVFHAVEWMRSAYYTGYPAQSLSKLYLVMFGLFSLTLGLILERTLKPYILNGQ